MMPAHECGVPTDEWVPQPIPDIEAQDDDDTEHEVKADA